MIIDIGDIPEDKDFDDYPEDTVFVLSEGKTRYDKREFIENMNLVVVEPGKPGYDSALTKEELYELARRMEEAESE